MLRLTLFVAALLLGPVAPASGQSDALPAVDSNRLMAPLTVDQLDAAERASYAALTPGSADARQFLYTRGFLRFAKLVVAGTLPPAQLPEIPEPGNWNRRHLSTAELPIVDTAVERYLICTLPGLRPRCVW